MTDNHATDRALGITGGLRAAALALSWSRGGDLGGNRRSRATPTSPKVTSPSPPRWQHRHALTAGRRRLAALDRQRRAATLNVSTRDRMRPMRARPIALVQATAPRRRPISTDRSRVIDHAPAARSRSLRLGAPPWRRRRLRDAPHRAPDRRHAPAMSPPIAVGRQPDDARSRRRCSDELDRIRTAAESSPALGLRTAGSKSCHHHRSRREAAGRVLDHLAEREQRLLVERPADQLQAERQALAVEPGRHRRCPAGPPCSPSP